MEKHRADDKVLSHDDVVLRRSDLDILNGPHFLNDRIIEFYFSYLSSGLNDDSVLLVPPSITQWIKECSGSIEDFVKPLDLPSKKLILFPVNDNDDVTWAGGGSHWSLLAFFQSANVFVHHDSSRSNSNKLQATRLCSAVLRYTSENADYVECPSSPKQVNGYDCGVYVIAVARAVCMWFKKASEKNTIEDTLWFDDLDHINPSAVSWMRTEILDLIKNLMGKQ